MRRIITLAAAFCIAVSTVTAANAAQQAVGVVFHDANSNGIRDTTEKGIKGVRVSNGRTSVRTDDSGKYSLPVNDDTIIFVIKPRNWRTAIDENNVPRFYYIHKPNGSPKLKYQGSEPTGPLPASVDFPLYPQPEPDRFKAVFLGDTQVTSPESITYLAHDIIEELASTDALFGVVLGDVVGDKLHLYEELLPVMGKMGMPCHYVKGNHDSNYDGRPDQKLVDETFERVFGPSHYSFDYGPVHFIALDNPFFARAEGYEARLDMEQMAFLRHDLASIPKDQLVVLMMHIPIMQMKDRETIFKMLETHPNTFSVSAHTHTQRHCFLTKDDRWNGPKPHHHLINATACGSWWSGSLDETGLPHTTMRDGAPNGYSIVTFDGTQYSVRFKAARKPESYQMNIFAPDLVKASQVEQTEVLVNIFAGSERSTVEMRLGDKGAWTPMQLVNVSDPVYARTKSLEDSQKPGPAKKLPGAANSTHIWKANLPKDTPKGTHLIQVRTTDMFGQTFMGSRIITVR